MSHSQKFTAKKLIQLAEDAKKEIAAGNLDPDSEVYISLEVCNEHDEDTFHHRVHGGEPIQVGIGLQIGTGKYVHIQLIGKPNFDVYPHE